MVGIISPSVQEVQREGLKEYGLVGSSRLYLSESSCITEERTSLGAAFDGTLFLASALAEQLHCKTEDHACLLLEAYKKWGLDFPDHLDGEFSFVLWDRTNERIVLGCSPGNCFPLFYTQQEESLYFASELDALLRSLPRIPALDENYIAHWMALTFCGSTSTFFEGVFRLLPGSILIFKQGSIRIETYWHLEKVAPLRLRDPREYVEGLREVLQKAIENRVAGCRVGTHLSGGLDSSSVTALAAEILQKEDQRLYAFTAVPQYPVEDCAGRFCDEGPAAASVAAMWPNVDHVLVPHGRHSVLSLMDLFGAAQMEPIINPANYDWLYEICVQAQHRHLDILLSGDAGNLSVSYDGRLALHTLASNGAWERMFRLAWRMHCKGHRRWRSILYEALGTWIPLPMRALINHMRGNTTNIYDFSLMRRDFARIHGLNDLSFFEKTSCFDANRLRAMHLRRPESANCNQAFRRLTGVIRHDPTGDRRVVEYCLSVPLECYCENGVPRSLIRNAMVDRLPETVRSERRRGLQAADCAKHFLQEKAEAFAEIERLKHCELATRVLDLKAMEQMLHYTDAQIATQQGMLLYWPKLLRALSLGRFVRRYEDGSLFTIHVQQEDSSYSVAAS